MAWVLAGGPGTLLHAVQMSRLHQDSKHFVDMPLRPEHTPAALREAFAALPLTSQGQPGAGLPNQEALQQLLGRFFLPPGHDLEEVTPDAMSEEGPEWIQGLEDKALAGFALDVYRLWSLLCRTVSDHVLHRPENHTLLYLSQPFMIAGDRFRECYYWDSYWVVRGLMVSDMCDTARDVVTNLLSLVDHVGHVPNGARNYYRNRSQPPVMSAMVMSAAGLRPGGPCSGPTAQPAAGGAAAAGAGAAVGPAGSGRGGPGAQGGGSAACDVDTELLRYALPRLIKTWQYWTTGPKAVTITTTCPDPDGPTSSATTTTHTLSRYIADWCSPRPESYREDWELAASQWDLGQPAGLEAARKLWRELASAAESGWDFSSRWCDPDRPRDLATTCTTQVLPVDLNAFVAMLAADIAHIAQHLGEVDAHSEFTGYARQRWASLHELMWCQEDGCWNDLRVVEDAAATLTNPNPHAAATLTNPNHPAQAAGLQEHREPAAEAAGSDEDSLGDVNEAGTPPVAVVQLRRKLASNWMPLWAGGVVAGSEQAAIAVAGLQRSGLVQPGGVATSLVNTGQQWDAPNAWPPLQHMLIEGLRHAGVTASGALAEQLAGRFLHGAWAAHVTTGHMHEKYDAAVPGTRGGGGEYDPQVGFGWTNGVVLDLLASGYRPSTQ